MRLDKRFLMITAMLLAGMVMNGCWFAGETEAAWFTGTVVKTTNGDRACYVDLKDRNGNPINLLADFSICEINLTGKRIRYRMGQAKLIAPSCEGAPDCKKTVSENIIMTAEVLP